MILKADRIVDYTELRMDNSLKDILLISYVFPPHYGIGGRRWAKHADALTKLGYRVHVICAKNLFSRKSLWTGIVENNPDIILYPVSARFPKVLVSYEHSFFEKILYRFWVTVLPFFTKGSYLDRTILWKRTMLKKARQVISENRIKHVICTGGPFGGMYYTTLLKRWFADLFIINDLRDPWTWGPNWGFPGLEEKRMNYEQSLERKTILDSSIITVPTQEMKNYLDRKYPESAAKIKTLHHFFDKDEIKVEEKTKSEKLRLIFYGAIYHHITELLEEAAGTLAHYRQQVSLDIFTDKKQYQPVFTKHGAHNVRFFDQIPANELFKLFKNYDYVLLMIPAVGVDHISTKFYEIIYSRTPFLIFCTDGLAPQFIRKNNLGIHASRKHFRDVLDKLVKDKCYRNYNNSFEIEEFSLERNAKQIESMLLAGNVTS